MAKHKKPPVTEDAQLQLALENLAELKAMTPLVFKGIDLFGKKMASRREELKAQAAEILRRKA